MGMQHSETMQVFFNNMKGVGIDLGNVEIKECNNKWHKYTVNKKDNKAPFLLFYDHVDKEFNFVNQVEFKRIPNSCTVSTQQLRKEFSYKTTRIVMEFMNEMEEIIEDKSFLAWI